MLGSKLKKKKKRLETKNSISKTCTFLVAKHSNPEKFFVEFKLEKSKPRVCTSSKGVQPNCGPSSPVQTL